MVVTWRKTADWLSAEVENICAYPYLVSINRSKQINKVTIGANRYTKSQSEQTDTQSQNRSRRESNEKHLGASAWQSAARRNDSGHGPALWHSVLRKNFKRKYIIVSKYRSFEAQAERRDIHHSGHRGAIAKISFVTRRYTHPLFFPQRLLDVYCRPVSYCWVMAYF